MLLVIILANNLYQKNKKYFVVIYTVFITTNNLTTRYLIQKLVSYRLIYFNKYNCKSIIFMDNYNKLYHNLLVIRIPK